MNDSHDHAPTGPARVVLAERKNAGIQVTLLWVEETDAVAALVRNDGTDDEFELNVEPGGNVASTTASPTSETRLKLRSSRPCAKTRQERLGLRTPTRGHV